MNRGAPALAALRHSHHYGMAAFRIACCVHTMPRSAAWSGSRPFARYDTRGIAEWRAAERSAIADALDRSANTHGDQGLLLGSAASAPGAFCGYNEDRILQRHSATHKYFSGVSLDFSFTNPYVAPPLVRRPAAVPVGDMGMTPWPRRRAIVERAPQFRENPHHDGTSTPDYGRAVACSPSAIKEMIIRRCCRCCRRRVYDVISGFRRRRCAIADSRRRAMLLVSSCGSVFDLDDLRGAPGTTPDTSMTAHGCKAPTPTRPR